MIQISQHGPVTRFKMGREIDGRVMYWCAAYQVGDVLIDSGCVHTAPDLLGALRGRGCARCSTPITTRTT